MVCKHKKSDPETFLRYFGSSSLDNSLRLSLPWPLPLARKHSANKSHEMKKHAFPSDFGSDLTGFGQLMRSFGHKIRLDQTTRRSDFDGSVVWIHVGCRSMASPFNKGSTWENWKDERSWCLGVEPKVDH